MQQSLFIGRKEQLQALKRESNRGKGILIAITGRRRIGKSRLIEEFSKGRRLIKLTGLPPIDSMNAQGQRDEFARQMSAIFRLPEQKITDWGDAFYYLINQVTNEPTIILFD